MELVKIISSRIVIGANVYSRYFVDTDGQIVGIPTGISFAFDVSSCGRYVSIRYCVKIKNLPRLNGTMYANTTRSLCDVLKKCIAKHLANQEKPSSYSNGNIDRKQTKQNYAGVITPVGVSFYKKSSGHIGFSVNTIDEKTLKRRSEFWYCGSVNTWRARYFKTLKMVLKYKRANDKLYSRVTTLLGSD